MNNLYTKEDIINAFSKKNEEQIKNIQNEFVFSNTFNGECYKNCEIDLHNKDNWDKIIYAPECVPLQKVVDNNFKEFDWYSFNDIVASCKNCFDEKSFSFGNNSLNYNTLSNEDNYSLEDKECFYIGLAVDSFEIVDWQLVESYLNALDDIDIDYYINLGKEYNNECLFKVNDKFNEYKHSVFYGYNENICSLENIYKDGYKINIYLDCYYDTPVFYNNKKYNSCRDFDEGVINALKNDVNKVLNKNNGYISDVPDFLKRIEIYDKDGSLVFENEGSDTIFDYLDGDLSSYDENKLKETLRHEALVGYENFTFDKENEKENNDKKDTSYNR